MNEPIKVGDSVHLIWACCAEGRKYIGWCGEVEQISVGRGVCHCGFKTYGRQAWITLPCGSGTVPLSWLRKIPPTSELESEQRKEEIKA